MAFGLRLLIPSRNSPSKFAATVPLRKLQCCTTFCRSELLLPLRNRASKLASTLQLGKFQCCSALCLIVAHVPLDSCLDFNPGYCRIVHGHLFRIR